MNRISDDQWVSAARARAGVEGKSWDITFLPDLSGAPRARGLDSEARPEARAVLVCPRCGKALAVLTGASHVPDGQVLVCEACFGLLIERTALTGLGNGGSEHPALHAALPPRNCIECGGALKPDDVCSRCGESLPERDCPRCGVAMERSRLGGVMVDTCPGCHALWLDVGEVAQLLPIERPQSLASRQIQEQYGEAPDEGGELLTVLAILARLFLPFL